MPDRVLVTLNNKLLNECYAFELGIIVRNLRADGMRCSRQRQIDARNELERRARDGDYRSETVLAGLAGERMG